MYISTDIIDDRFKYLQDQSNYFRDQFKLRVFTFVLTRKFPHWENLDG